jgi:hypothetical protein
LLYPFEVRIAEKGGAPHPGLNAADSRLCGTPLKPRQATACGVPTSVLPNPKIPSCNQPGRLTSPCSTCCNNLVVVRRWASCRRPLSLMALTPLHLLQRRQGMALAPPSTPLSPTTSQTTTRPPVSAACTVRACRTNTAPPAWARPSRLEDRRGRCSEAAQKGPCQVKGLPNSQGQPHRHNRRWPAQGARSWDTAERVSASVARGP